ncbi:MAG: heme exporter protein CcmD [Betaproteobacteria bacterium]|nr:heme exporter protein CcmD [Betaproteobacteria bacterium]
MTWGSLNDFLVMGGYALYVWGSYGMAAVLAVAEIMALRARRRRAMDELRRARSAPDGSMR